MGTNILVMAGVTMALMIIARVSPVAAPGGVHLTSASAGRTCERLTRMHG